MKNANDERRLRRTLAEYAANDVPANIDLRAAVQAQLPLQPTPSLPRRVSRPVVATLAVSGLLLLLLALAFIPAWGFGLPLAGSAGSNSAQPPVQQTLQGYTITIAGATIDANWTVVTYTLSSPTQPLTGVVPGNWGKNGYSGARLTGENGPALYYLGTVFPGTYNTDALPWSTPIDEARLVYRTPSLGKGPAQQLHLSFSLARLQQPAATAPAQPWWNQATMPVAGPFSFSIDAPVNRQARMADVEQTLTAGKVTLRLEQVIVTASSTRIFLRPLAGGPSANTSPANAQVGADATLKIGAWTSEQHDGVGVMTWDGARFVYEYVDYPLLDKTGDWTMNVQSLPALSGSQQGPWAFHFKLPEVTAQP